MGESVCLHSGRANDRIARLSNVVGPYESGLDTFVSVLCREAAAGRIVLQTALKSAKDYIWIDDVVDLLFQISTTGRQQIYNVASGRQISHADWTSAISNVTGCSLEIVPDAPEVSSSPISIARIEHEFKFQSRPILDKVPHIVGGRAAKSGAAT